MKTRNYKARIKRKGRVTPKQMKRILANMKSNQPEEVISIDELPLLQIDVLSIGKERYDLLVTEREERFKTITRKCHEKLDLVKNTFKDVLQSLLPVYRLELYKLGGYESFKEYIIHEFNLQPTMAYQYLRIQEGIDARIVDTEDVAQIGYKKSDILIRNSKTLKRAKILDETKQKLKSGEISTTELENICYQEKQKQAIDRSEKIKAAKKEWITIDVKFQVKKKSEDSNLYKLTEDIGNVIYDFMQNQDSIILKEKSITASYPYWLL